MTRAKLQMTHGVRPVALTIAGSDSGGGAGIQADLRVFHRLGVFGTSAITAVTAQSLEGVSDVKGMDPALVRAQITAVTRGFEVRAAKTGMLWSTEIVEAVADLVAASEIPVVVDPVMVATSGARLLDESAIEAYCSQLLPQAALATPNLDEAAVLLGRPAIAPAELEGAAEELFDRFGCAILLKGGHLAGDPVDLLRHPGGLLGWTHARIPAINTHGSGCMLSAAIAAFLATGAPLLAACERGLAFVHDALARGVVLEPEIRLADIESAEPDTSALAPMKP